MATVITPRRPRVAARRRERGYITGLLLLALATRLPFLSNAPAEPDSARFLMGVWRWMREGPKVNFAASVHGAIYGDFLSPGYYALAATLNRLLQVSVAHEALMLNLISLAAALASVPLLYRLLRLWVEPAAAAAATALLLLAPGFWWLGLEPHPQGLATALWLGAALLAARAPSGRGLAAAGVVLWLALLVRADFILYAGALVPLLLRRAKEPERARRLQLRAALGRAAAIAVPAGVAFLLARAWLLQRPLAALASETGAVSGGYMQHGFQLIGQLGYLARQLLPFPFAVGPWVALWTLAGVLLWLRRARPRLLPLASAVAWSVPGAVFWFLILGNTTRHVVLLLLPWMALAAAGWLALGQRRLLWTTAAAAVALNFVTIPPHTDLVLMPSANVPMSLPLLRRELALSRHESARLEAAAYALGPRAGALCYFGASTNIYIEWDLVRRHPQLTVSDAALAPTYTGLPLPAAPLRFVEAYSVPEMLRQNATCALAKSLEWTVSPSPLLADPWSDALRRLRHRVWR